MSKLIGKEKTFLTFKIIDHLGLQKLVDYKISRLLVITLERRFRSWVLALKTMIVQPSEAPKEAVICFLLLDKVLQQILKLPSTEIGTFHRSKYLVFCLFHLQKSSSFHNNIFCLVTLTPKHTKFVMYTLEGMCNFIVFSKTTNVNQ